MQKNNLISYIARIYLILVPIITSLLGFTVKDVSARIYLPFWIANVLFMLVAIWVAGFSRNRITSKENKSITLAGVFLIAPWLLFSIYGGMGSPPDTYAKWVARAFEQQTRYAFLIIGGIVMLFGFSILRERMKATKGHIYALIGSTAINIATGLFILNMAYWHSYLLETFRIAGTTPLQTLPDWYIPVKKMFLVISVTEVSLTYLAIAAFVAALKSAGWFTKVASNTYILISLTAFLLVALYGLYPDSLTAAGFPFYPFMIPAIPFIMPYYIGLNLLQAAGKQRLEKGADFMPAIA